MVDSSDRSDEEKAEIHRVFAEGGEAAFKRFKRRVLQRVLNDPQQNQRAVNVASAYAFAGDREHALRFLRTADQGDPRLKWVRVLPSTGFCTVIRSTSSY